MAKVFNGVIFGYIYGQIEQLPDHYLCVFYIFTNNLVTSGYPGVIKG